MALEKPTLELLWELSRSSCLRMLRELPPDWRYCSVRVCFGDLDVEGGRRLEKELTG